MSIRTVIDFSPLVGDNDPLPNLGRIGTPLRRRGAGPRLGLLALRIAARSLRRSAALTLRASLALRNPLLAD